MKFNRAGRATWPLVVPIAALFLAAANAWRPALEFRPAAFATASLEVTTESFESFQTPTDTEAIPSDTPEQPTDTEAVPSETPQAPSETQPPPPASPTNTQVPPTNPPPPSQTQPTPPSPAATITPPPSATRGQPPPSRTPSATATRSRTPTPTRTGTPSATRTATPTPSRTPTFTPPVVAATLTPIEVTGQQDAGSQFTWAAAVAIGVTALAGLAGLAVIGGLAWLASRRQPAVATSVQAYPISTFITGDDCNCTISSLKFEEEEKDEQGKKTKQKKIKIKYNTAYKPPGVKGDADQIEFETKLLIELATKGAGKTTYKITPTVQLFLYQLNAQELQEVQKLRWKRPRSEAEEQRLRDLLKKMDLGLIDAKNAAPAEDMGGDLDCPYEGSLQQEIKGDVWWEAPKFRIGTKDKPQVRSFMLYIKAEVECGKDSRMTDLYWTAQVEWEKGKAKISSEQIT